MIKFSKRVICCLLSFVLSSGYIVGRAETVADSEAGVVTGMVTVSPEIQKMMSVLKMFEIIPEYYDYNVPIAFEVTRADFAAAIARLIGKNVYSGTNVYFYDVPKTHWAYNEISNLTEIGIILGSGNKMFNPDVTITKGEACKILLTAMGYDMYAESNGGFPNGYTKIANEIGLTKGVSSNSKVIMSDMFYMICNAMKIDVMRPSLSTENIAYEPKSGESILTVYRDVYYNKGIVRGANTITLDNGVLNEDEVLIDNEYYKTGDVQMFDFIGQDVEFFYYQDDSDEKTILWVSSLKEDDILNINVDNNASFDEKTFKYTYYNENGKDKTISLEKGMTLIYNGGIVESGYGEILNGKKYSVRFIERDGKYTVAVVREYKNYVAGLISSSEFKIYDKIVPRDYVVLDEELYNTFSIRMSGLSDIDFEDITEGSVLSVFESKDKKHIEVIVNNNMVVGTIKKIVADTECYNIFMNETEYRMDKEAYDSSFSSGDDVKAYLDFNGDIAYMEIGESKFRGAFLINLYLSEELDNELSIKYLAENGKITSSKCAQKVTVDGIRFKDATEVQNALIAGEVEFNSQFALIRKNSDNEIVEIDTAEYKRNYETTSSLRIDVPFNKEGEKNAETTGVRATAAAARIGTKIIFDTDSIVFSVPEDNYKTANESEFTVFAGSGLSNNTYANAQSYKTTEDGGISKYILVKEYDSKGNTFELPILVESVEKGVNNEDVVVDVLNGYQGNTYVSLYADSDSSNLFSGIKPGDLVKPGRNNAGNVDKCDVLFDNSADVKTSNDALYGVFSGYVNNVIGDVVKMGYKSGDMFDYAIRVGTSPVLIYDTKKVRKPVSTGNIGEAATYKNAGNSCSKIVIITSKMQPKMFVIYK